MNDDKYGNGWAKYQELVLASLKRNETLIVKMDEKMDDFVLHINNRMTKVESKAGLWGAVAGTLPVIGSLLIYLLIKGLS